MKMHGNYKEVTAFHEMIANFTDMKLEGNSQALSELRDVFGDDFYNWLNYAFNCITK